MRGYKYFNFPAFADAEQVLKAKGWHPISPAALDVMIEGWYPHPPENLQVDRQLLERVIRRDLDVLAGCDAIYMLKGWEDSKGANLEMKMAEYLGMDVFYE
jgi:hypothetical protein